MRLESSKSKNYLLLLIIYFFEYLPAEESHETVKHISCDVTECSAEVYNFMLCYNPISFVLNKYSIYAFNHLFLYKANFNFNYQYK